MFTTVGIIGHRGIVLQANNENVALMVLEEFNCSFCYTSFRTWIQATTVCVQGVLGAESSQELRNVPVFHVTVTSGLWNDSFWQKPISSNVKILNFIPDTC